MITLSRTLVLLALMFFSLPLHAEDNEHRFLVTPTAQFDAPWALEFLPDGKMLISEMGGTLKLVDENGVFLHEITGVPEVVFKGQGSMGDMKIHPHFGRNRLVYLSYAEKGENDLLGTAVALSLIHI